VRGGGGMEKIRTLIVDDEPLARQRIRHLLADEPDILVTGECRDGEEALDALRETGSDLLFLDVQMPAKDGFEVLADLDPGQMPVAIFVTAYDQYALKAFEVHALDYLLKPFDEDRFKEALSRARRALEQRSSESFGKKILSLLGEREEAQARLRRFVVRESGRIFFVKAIDVDCIEASRNYAMLYTGNKSHLIRETMAELEKRLDPSQFVRVHRSWIVNVERIRELQPWFNGAYVMIMQGGKRLTSSRSFKENVEAMIMASK
jgi:two-component system LytT family response regulator